MAMNATGLKDSYEAHQTAYPWGCGNREKIILQYYDLVKFIAYRLASRLPSHVCLDDLFNSGVIGLMDAIDKFDPSQGILFETYAKFRIRGAMLDDIRSMDCVSRSLRQKCNHMEKTCAAMEHRLGRFPKDEEIAEELNMSLDDYFKLLDEIKSITLVPEDLHDMVYESREPIALATNPEGPLQNVYQQEIKALLAEAIRSLSEKEQLVLSLYYYEELTMREIGEVMGYTESRISQLHSKAVIKMRIRLAKKMKAEDLPEWLKDTKACGN